MSEARLAGLRVVQDGGRDDRGGNLLLLDDTPGREAFLKVYRRRGTALRQASKWVSYRLFELKRGVTPRERCALERRHLALWRAEGFDVPALLDRPLPEGFEPETALWLEYCPGPLLYELVGNRDVPIARRSEEVARFARTLSDRQRRALDQEQRGLVMKHASIKHVILYAGRQVSFDLEGAYADSWPMLDALADELASNLRSLLRVLREDERAALGGVFVESYGRTDQLREIAAFGIRGGGPHRAIRRWADRRRRAFSEYDALCWAETRA